MRAVKPIKAVGAHLDISGERAALVPVSRIHHATALCFPLFDPAQPIGPLAQIGNEGIRIHDDRFSRGCKLLGRHLVRVANRENFQNSTAIARARRVWTSAAVVDRGA